MAINIWHILGILFTLILIAVVGVYSGSKVKDAKDFTTGGGKAGPWLVGGAIMGSLVSGQATIGTAQFAFSFGISAWWYTLGAGLGCLLLGIGYAIPLRRSGSVTLLQIISEEYGEKAGYFGSVLCSVGIFISVISQMLAATALVTTILPLSSLAAGLLSAGLMMFYVVFGGAWGAGMGGVVKLCLLYLASVLGFVLVITFAGGPQELVAEIGQLMVGTSLGAINGVVTSGDVSGRFFDMFTRGMPKELGSLVSLLVGVLSTQTYAQAIWSGKSDSKARKGAFLSALMIPPIGVACTMIGMFMRTKCITTDEILLLAREGEAIPKGLMEISSSSQVFPAFVIHYMPSVLGGIVLGALFIAVVGGGAGLSLGVATILVNDIIKKVWVKLNDAKQLVRTTRITIVIVLLTAMTIAMLVPGAIINDFGFLSMGLRGTVCFFPVTCALFLKGKIAPKWVTISIILGPAAVLVGRYLSLPFDSLFLGLAVSLLCMIAGKEF